MLRAGQEAGTSWGEMETMTISITGRRSFVLVLLLEGTRALIPATPGEQSK